MHEMIKILVVDDNEDFCKNIADILQLKGYEVATAYDGSAALELAKQNHFDVVIMDIKMPVMNGVDAFKRMKSIAPDTAVIIVTAYAMEELIREALREGAFGFLSKPLDIEKLFVLIERAIPDGPLVMMVDDDEKLCANVSDILSNKGYRVSVVHDGDKALDKARENNFDVLLLDMKLPHMNGLETLIAIRDFRPNVMVIVITGYATEMCGLIKQALNKHVLSYLKKPIDMDELASLLERVTK